MQEIAKKEQAQKDQLKREKEARRLAKEKRKQQIASLSFNLFDEGEEDDEDDGGGGCSVDDGEEKGGTVGQVVKEESEVESKAETAEGNVPETSEDADEQCSQETSIKKEKTPIEGHSGWLIWLF